MVSDKKHLAFVRDLVCVAHDYKTIPSRSQAAHIRKGAVAEGGGLNIKLDNRAVPLCPSCHTIQHQQGEITFWYPFGGWERAVVLAKKLYEDTGDLNKATKHIIWFRRIRDEIHN